MVFKKQPAGTQRTLVYRIRVKPQFKDVIEKKLEWLRQQPKWKDATISDLLRIAVAKYCTEVNPDEPRTS